MTLAPVIEQLLQQLPAPDRLQVDSLFAAIAKVKFTGAITLHCRNGIPMQVDLGAPIRLSIVEGVDMHAKVSAG